MYNDIDKIKWFLNDYKKYFIEGDLEKLIQVAQQQEKEERMQQSNLEGTDNTHPPTTRRQYSPESDKPKVGRCTVPMAMMLLGTIDAIGAVLILPTNDLDFRKRSQAFFNYGGYNLPVEEEAFLNAIYRNGLMHSLFPKGEALAISYDSYFINIDKLFCLLPDKTICMNVNYLSKIVPVVLNKLIDDQKRQEEVAHIFSTILELNEKEKNFFQGYKSYVC